MMDLIEMFKSKKGNAICECGTIFQCDIEAGKSSCWCFNVNTTHNVFNKHESAFSDNEKCYCKKCLIEKDHSNENDSK